MQICLHTHAKRTTRNRLSTKQCHYGESHCHENKEHDNRGKTQSPTGYCQIIDSVVLRSVCETKKGEKVLDEEPRKPLTQAREGKKTKEENKGMKVSHLSQTHNARCQTWILYFIKTSKQRLTKTTYFKKLGPRSGWFCTCFWHSHHNRTPNRESKIQQEGKGNDDPFQVYQPSTKPKALAVLDLKAIQCDCENNDKTNEPVKYTETDEKSVGIEITCDSFVNERRDARDSSNEREQ